VGRILTANTPEADGGVAAMTDQIAGAISSLVYLVTRRAVRQVDHRLTTVTPASPQPQQPNRRRRRRHYNLPDYRH